MKKDHKSGQFFPPMSSLKHFLFWYPISIDGGAALETHLKCPTPWCQTWKWFKFNCRPLLNRTISNPTYFNWRWTNHIMLKRTCTSFLSFKTLWPTVLHFYSEIFEELPSSVTMNLIRGLDLGWNWGKLAENWMKLTPDGKFNLVVHSKSYSLTQTHIKIIELHIIGM